MVRAMLKFINAFILVFLSTIASGYSSEPIICEPIPNAAHCTINTTAVQHAVWCSPVVRKPYIVFVEQTNAGHPTVSKCLGKNGIVDVCKQLNTSYNFECMDIWSDGAAGYFGIVALATAGSNAMEVVATEWATLCKARGGKCAEGIKINIFENEQIIVS